MKKKVVIMRGLPGCGKTHHALALTDGNPNAVVLSADNFHNEKQPDGTIAYRFKPENARKAHDQCYTDFLAAGNMPRVNLIVIDNTNTTAWEISPYYRLAEVSGCEVEIRYIRCPIEKCVARGTHGVPLATYVRMAANLEHDTLPPWWNVVTIDAE